MANFSVVVKADSGNYWIDLSVSPSPYVLRNDVILINATGNFTTATVEFWHEGVYLAGYSHTANTTQQFTVSDAYPYGEYEIKAVAGNTTTKVFLSVVDIGGWLPTSFPYQRIHKGIDYTFYGNGSIKADNGEDIMFVDLSTLRYLKNFYDLDVDVYYNSMNFRVRFYKTGIANINFVFSFIHTGCKFVVEGELDHARDFEFNIANPQRLRSLVDSVKQGNIIFDYSDLRKVAHAFSYSNGTLTLSLPQSFSFDPTIFADGFETNDFSAWDGTTGAPTTTDAQAHCGTYSMYVTGAGTDYVRKDFSAETTLFVRFYFRINTDIPNYNTWVLADLKNGATTVCRLAVYRGGGDAYSIKVFRWYPAFAESSSVSITVATGEWHCYEIKGVIDGVAGEFRSYFDGDAKGSETGLDTSGGTQFTRVHVGNSETGTVDYHIDCVVFSDEYIGPESGGPEPVNLSVELVETFNVTSSLTTQRSQLVRYGETTTFQTETSTQREGLIIFEESFSETFRPSAVLVTVFSGEYDIGELALGLAVLAFIIAVVALSLILSRKNSD